MNFMKKANVNKFVSLSLLLANLDINCAANLTNENDEAAVAKTEKTDEQKEKDTRLVWMMDTDNVEAVRELIKSGADVNAKTGDGMSALIRATYKKRPRLVQLLVDSGADINIRDSRGQTALIWATSGGCGADMIKLLIANKIDVNAVDNGNSTALMKTHDLAKIQPLLDAGADLDIRREDGKRAIDIWQDYGTDFFEPTIKLLRSEQPRRHAAKERHNEIIKCLKEQVIPEVLVNLIEGYLPNELTEPNLLEQAGARRRKKIKEILMHSATATSQDIINLVDTYLPSEVEDYIEAYNGK